MRLNQDLIQRMFDGRGGAAGGGSSLDPGLINGLATEMWTEENYVSKTFFNELFVIHKKTTTTIYDGDTVVSTTTDTSGTFAPNEIPSQEESTDEETGYRTVVVTEVDNIEAKKGLWTDFFLSALGLNGSGGGGGIGDVTWQALGNQLDDRQIASSHLTTALNNALVGYATQSWVTSQNYVTQSAISDMATKTWVNNQSFVNWTALGDTTTTQQIALSHLTTALSTYATQSWVTSNFSTPSTVATQLQTYAKIQSGTITIGDTSITPITSVTGTFWGKSFTNGGTVNGTIKAGTSGGAIEQFHSVEMNSAGTLAGYGGFIDFHYYATGSTFDSSLDYTSRIIESAVGVISILAKNNDATNANKLAGLLVGAGFDGSYVQIGDLRIVYDSTNNALKVVKLVSGSEVAANFYATGSVSALGYGAGGGGGTGDVTWDLLADNTDTRQIAQSHLTTALTNYALTSQLAGYLPLTGGTMTGPIRFTLGANGILGVDSSGIYIQSGNYFIRVGNSYSGADINGYTVLHSGNYSSYALPLSGGTLTATSGDYALTLKSASGGSFLGFKKSDNTFFGWFGYNSSGVPTVYVSGTARGIWHGGNFSPSDYLPLTGGTLTNASLSPLIINSTNPTYTSSYITFKNNGEKAWVGYDYNYGAFLQVTGGAVIGITTNGTPFFSSDGVVANMKTIWNEGNDGAGSGLDADLLDGEHGSYYAAASSLSNYLPLSGGTLTAPSNIDTPLILKSGKGGCYVGFKKPTENTFFGWFGYDVTGKPTVYENPTTPRVIWHSGNFTPSDYLPLSGGTLSSSAINFFHINTTNNSKKVWLDFQVSGTQKLYIGYEYNGLASFFQGAQGASLGILDDGTPYYWPGSGTNKYELIHGNNISSQSVAYATSATRLYANDEYGYGSTNPYYAYHTYDSTDQTWYLRVSPATPAAIKVDKAIKITSRTLWGQSFDGTANVSGTLTDVTGITSTGNITITGYDKHFSVSNGTNESVRFGYDSSAYIWGTTNGTYLRFSGGNVGVGTTASASDKLNVAGTVYSSGGLFVVNDSSNSTYDSLAYFRCYSNADWGVVIDKNSYSYGLYIKATGANALRVLNGGACIDGNVGIGISPSYKLHVAGTFYVSGAATLGSTLSVGGTTTVDGSVVTGSNGGAIEGFQSWELNTHNTAGTNIGGFLDFHYNGTAQDYSVRLIEKDYSGVLQILAKDTGTGNAQRAGLIVGAGTYTSFIQLGNGRIVWDDTNHALRIVDKDGNACNLYATGGISALGYQSGGGGGGSTGVFSTSITPDTTGTYDIGTSTYKWRNLYLAGANGGNGFSIITSYSSYVYIGSLNKILFGADVEFEDTAYVENRMGIGVRNGNYDLFVNGENEGNAYFAGDVSVASLTNRSDMRLKDVVGDVNLSVQQIASAPTFKFRFKENAKRTMVGTSAQYWDAVLPESVTRDADGILGLDYGVTALVSTIILAKGMTEHERRITKLEKENAELRARIKDLEEN